MSEHVALHIEGISEHLAAIDDMIAALEVATELGTRRGLGVVEAFAKREAPVGKKLGGTLRRSIVQTRVMPVGPGRWEGHVGPTVIYGRRVHEGYVDQIDSLGRFFTGPQPNRYMRRGIDRSLITVAETFRVGWGSALHI